MRKFLVAVIAVVCGAGCAAATFADDLEILDPQISQTFAQFLNEAAGQIEKPQVKVDGDIEKATGVHREQIGLIIVPQKDLAPDNIPEGVNTETGAALGHLFMSNGFAPLVDGKPLDASKMRTLEIAGQDGTPQKISYLALAARHTDDDAWHLYGYGTDEKPVLDVQISEGSGPGTQPLAIEVREVDADNQGTCYVTIYDLYQGNFPIKYTAPAAGDGAKADEAKSDAK
jgi:hypothetical protein